MRETPPLQPKSPTPLAQHNKMCDTFPDNPYLKTRPPPHNGRGSLFTHKGGDHDQNTPPQLPHLPSQSRSTPTQNPTQQHTMLDLRTPHQLPSTLETTRQLHRRPRPPNPQRRTNQRRTKTSPPLLQHPQKQPRTHRHTTTTTRTHRTNQVTNNPRMVVFKP